MRELGRNIKIIMSVIVALLLIGTVYLALFYDWQTPDDGPDDGPDDISDYTPVTNLTGMIECSNSFSFEMYGQLCNESENVFFSPYSITTALGMAFEGANGTTADEMAQVLRLPKDNQTRLDLMKAFQTAINAESDKYELSTANAYWLAENQAMLETYRTAIESYYLAHGGELDFVGDPTGSAATINAWVEQETNGRIKDLIPASAITPLTYLILTNAIYFKSDWKYQFNSTATYNGTFYLNNGLETTAEYMNMNDEEIDFDYATNNECQMLRLPYKGEEVSMYIMLPHYGTAGMDALEEKLDSDYFEEMKENMHPEWINVNIPKFTFEQEYQLGDFLPGMGMPTAFQQGSADFSGITDAMPLYISQVIHKSFIEVNEEGTEAAAATAIIMPTFGVGPPQPINFYAYHPFIFFIQHESTGQILFMGKVGNPEA
ncbi:MAG: serpin family protein [Thermoplasmata archaeon]|nr:serpin family protein [Thermoplasmata archaeon]